MVIINHFIKSDRIELELKPSFMEGTAFKNNFHVLLKSGFKYNKVRRTYNKAYYNQSYTEERFNSDLDIVKAMFGHYRITVFKQLSEEGNI